MFGFDLTHLVLALTLTLVISVADAARARSQGRDADLEQVVEYGATIANADGISSRQGRPFREFPQGFQGRWAHVAADCRASGFSAILSSAILSIDANGLRQGEGAFAVTSIIQVRDNPRQISVSAHISNGEREWDSLEQFTLSNDGQVIEWLRLEPASGPAIRLYRCK
ncbi:hypothetical protein [Methylocystis parvus]|uniref:Uncharacterized protein n=1 Tax=Methylocystis parvus TaxID=134 RepID=A0A6B8MHI4_9HYPH|nr:hypothetical protein [Methylocystis parvus]QGN00101.1 hypothetical protein F7D14_21210 [Methylocystis parvus]WBK02399.1 hypothetical protein MMG94_21430 [Methylocystis parvus OBBP]